MHNEYPGKRFRLTILCLCICASLMAQMEFIFRVPLPERILVADSMYYTLPFDSTYQTQLDFVGKLKNFAIDHHDEQIQLLAESHQHYEEIFRNPASLDQHLKRLFKIIQICKLEGYQVLELRVLLRTAYMMEINSHLGGSIAYAIQAHELTEHMDRKYWLEDRTWNTYFLALRFYRIGDYTHALQYELSPELRYQTGHFAILNYDLLSQIYFHLGDLDSSALYIQKGLDVYEHADTIAGKLNGWRGIFEGYRGKILYTKNEYTQALPHFLYAVENTGSASMHENVTSFGLLAADCYVRLGQPEKAKALLPVIKGSVYHQTSTHCFIDYYKLLLVLGEYARNADQTSNILDSIQFWTLRQNTEQDQNVFARNEMELQSQNFAQDEIRLKHDIDRQRLLRNFLWSILGLAIVIFALLIYQKQRQLAKKDKAMAKSLNELDIFRQQMLEKTYQIELLESKFGATSNDAELEELKKSAILTDDDWLRFKEIFNKAHVGYLHRLQKKFPDLTAGETRLIALLRLSLNNKEMASILGVGTGAIRTMKSRLLLKLQLPEDAPLEEVVEGI